MMNALPSNMSGEDEKYLYFAAKTPALSSPFAITGKIAASEAVNASQSETNTKMPGFEAFCEIIGLLGVLLYKRR
jgi:hypothetical protein